jgi:hypothetical protein
MHTHTYIYTHAYTHIYMHTLIQHPTLSLTHTCTYPHLHTYIPISTFTHIHTHTHTHTHTQCERTIPELSRFPVLRQKLYKCVGELLRRRMRPTKQMIQHIVQIELGMCVCVCLYV